MAAVRQQAYRREDRLRQLRPDAGILVPVLLLAMVGVVMVGSASVAIVAGDAFHYLIRHLLFLGISVLALLVAMRLDTAWLEKISRLLPLPMLLLLALPLLPGIGVEVNGSRRWISLGIVNFQVVELVKLLLVIYLAGYLHRHASTLDRRIADTVKPLLVAGLLAVGLLLQPDLGSAMVLVMIATVMLFLAGAALRHLLMLAALAAPVFAVAALEPYRMQRLLIFRDPWSDVYGSGYQLSQALIAIGRGEWFGVGVGASIQKLFYLPEAHTDFILAVIAEETGLLGVTVIMLLYACLIVRSMTVGAQAHRLGQGFAGFLCWGIGIWLAIQALIGIGVNLGVLPTKGLTLPLVSSGGSSLLLSMVAIGLVLRIQLDVERLHLQRPRRHADWPGGRAP